MSDRNDIEPRKEPSQDRSRATFDAIVEAVARILAEEGPDALNTNRIAEVAGVSIGSLYQYFPNKESIVAQLIDIELERDIAQMEEQLEAASEAPLPELLRMMISGFIERTRRVQPVHEKLLPLVDEVERRDVVRRAVAEAHAQFVEVVKARRDELPQEFRDDPERLEGAIFLAGRALEAAINAAKVERPELWEGDLVEETTTRMLLAVLGK
ncbi:MAG: TetR/AcrR family transcriptional regulator [Myxococcota bacterium]